MVGICFLVIQVAYGLQVSIKENLENFKSKCWDIQTIDHQKLSEMIIQMTFMSCGKDSIDSETLSSMSISSDFKSLEYNSQSSSKSFYDFFAIFPEDFISTLQKHLKSTETGEIDLPADVKSFCLHSLNDWETVLHSDHDEVQGKVNKKEKHGIYMTIAWIYLIPLGIFVARYFKSTSWWILVHLSSVLAAGYLTYLGYDVIMEGGRHPYTQYKPVKFIHSRLGQSLISLLITSLFSGPCLSTFKIFTRRTTLVLVLVRFHRFLGYSIFATAVVNCYIGWSFVKSDYKYLFYAGIAFWVLAFTSFELRQRLYKNKREYRKEGLEETNHLDVLQNVKNQKFLVFCDEFVLDVHHFHRTHPGGSYFITENLGEDMGKYMVGCSSYSANFNAYEHSKTAFAIMKDLAVQKIAFPSGYFKKGQNNYEPHLFKLSKKIEVAKETFLFCFENEEVKLSKSCKEASWLGKHFSVSLPNNLGGSQRYYSSLFIHPGRWKRKLGIGEAEEGRSGDLKFIIKVYPGGKVSGFLGQLEENSSVLIRGPFGPGLALSELKGSYLALAGGTGLVPFLDLVYQYSSISNPSAFKLTLFAFFRDKESAIASDILEEVEKRHNDWFKYTLVTSGSRSQDLLDSIVQTGQSSDLTWICGPSGFNRSYHDLLLKSQVPRHKVILM